jgi:hypothetical protein
MNRRKPIEVSIAGEVYRASLLTCGVSWKLAEELRVIRGAMLKAVGGAVLTPEEETAYYPAALKFASAVLLPEHPECSPDWVGANVLDHELGAIIAKVWAASVPPSKAGSDPGAPSPQP